METTIHTTTVGAYLGFFFFACATARFVFMCRLLQLMQQLGLPEWSSLKGPRLDAALNVNFLCFCAEWRSRFQARRCGLTGRGPSLLGRRPSPVSRAGLRPVRAISSRQARLRAPCDGLPVRAGATRNHDCGH